MASSSKGKARYPGPRFCDYLNGLREEFDEQSNSTLKSTGPRRFDVYLHGLKCEFELMTGDIESLRKERDEFKAKGTYFLFLSWRYFTPSPLQSKRKHWNS